MSEIRAVRTKAGDWRLLDTMTETELRAYVAGLMAELETGIQVLAALAAYGKRRWPESEWEAIDDSGRAAAVAGITGKRP